MELLGAQSLSVYMQSRWTTGSNPTDGAELIWKMAQILEKGKEVDWVQTIVKVHKQKPPSTCMQMYQHLWI